MELSSKWLILELLLFSHGVADFVLQSSKMIENKVTGRWTTYISHFFIVWGLSVLFLYPFISWQAGGVLLGLAFTHLVIDWIGYHLTPPHKIDSNPLGFVLDQLSHLIFILLAWQWLCHFSHLSSFGFYSEIMTPDWIEKLTSVMVVGNVYLYVVFGGAIFIGKAMRSLPQEVRKYEITGMGRYIGILERTIILTFILYQAVTGIAFVLMAKSLTRYQELNNKSFAEYYLIGTLWSTALALIGGLFFYLCK